MKISHTETFELSIPELFLVSHITLIYQPIYLLFLTLTFLTSYIILGYIFLLFLVTLYELIFLARIVFNRRFYIHKLTFVFNENDFSVTRNGVTTIIDRNQILKTKIIANYLIFKYKDFIQTSYIPLSKVKDKDFVINYFLHAQRHSNQ